MADLNAEFAAYIRRKLAEDPEVAEELEELGALREWVAEKVREQWDSDEVAPCVKRFIRANLNTAQVMRILDR